MIELIKDSDYKNWLIDLKSKIKQSQIKAALSVNAEVILLYWDLGKQIVEKQKTANWGFSVINQLSKDLSEEFKDLKGFSKSNLYSMKQFYETFSVYNEYFHQLGGKIEIQSPIPEIVEIYCCKLPWRHIVLVLQKVKEMEKAIFYFQETIQNNWSRNVLNMQIESKLFERQGKAITNFKNVLPALDADLLNETLKNPYNFDFLTLERNALEKEIEKGLIANITKFIMELGKGFAFIGKQYQIEVNNKAYYLDLLFYHVKLHCYIVIELKVGEFEPEYIGKLNFYLSAVDAILKTDFDNPSIGILLCKNQSKIEVEFALKDINKPIGVSEFSFNELPMEIQREMPSLEELEFELIKQENNNGQ